MDWIQWYYLITFTVGLSGIILKIGEPREPYTPGVVLLTIFISIPTFGRMMGLW
jgi:hypothetical protein